MESKQTSVEEGRMMECHKRVFVYQKGMIHVLKRLVVTSLLVKVTVGIKTWTSNQWCGKMVSIFWDKAMSFLIFESLESRF